MNTEKHHFFSNNKERQYIIDLQRSRSLFALLASFISLFFAIYAITSGLVLYGMHGVSPIKLFRFFTITANAITAFSSAMIIPYALEGFRKKRFYCPKWAFLFYYSSTVCTTLIMFFATFVISRVSMEQAFGGYNFYLHLVCPIMILISFFLLESYYKLSIKDAVMSIIPFFIYVIVYIYKVILTGESAGGWPDIYYVTKSKSLVLVFIAVMAAVFFIAYILRLLYNKLNDWRKKKFIDNL